MEDDFLESLDPLQKLGSENVDIVSSKGTLETLIRHLSRAMGISSLNPRNDEWEGYLPDVSDSKYVAAFNTGKPTFDLRGNLIDYDLSVDPRIVMPTQDRLDSLIEGGRYEGSGDLLEILSHELGHSGLNALATDLNLAPKIYQGQNIGADISQIVGLLPGFDPNPHWDTFLNDYKRQWMGESPPTVIFSGEDTNFNTGKPTFISDDFDKLLYVDKSFNPFVELDSTPIVDFEHDLLYSMKGREGFGPPLELEPRFRRDYESIVDLIEALQ